jgi:hypothetical protein
MTRDIQQVHGDSDHMKVKRIYYDKAVLPDGAVVEMAIWQLPEPTAQRPHGLKYRLLYGRDGQQVAGYDNQRGKGGNKHLHGLQTHYRFVSIEKLMADFLVDVKGAKGDA